jgi:SAM-dependent methyltransferase
MSDPTIDYYNRLGKDFAARTQNLDMSALYEPFLALVPHNGYVLDASCGSGRDSKAFLEGGYRVLSTDASETMADIASAVTGTRACVMRFQEIDFVEEFDAIWACGSLLHVPGHEMHSVLGKMAAALKPAGTIYMSFKVGEQDEVREGRLFTNYTEATMRELIVQVGLGILSIWTTQDIRSDGNRPDWLNVLLRKRS